MIYYSDSEIIFKNDIEHVSRDEEMQKSSQEMKAMYYVALLCKIEHHKNYQN